MSMADRDGFIWYDGKLVPWREANTHVLTHSLHYGLAVFEGVRAYKTESLGTAIFRVQEHTKRLFNSAKIYMGTRAVFTTAPTPVSTAQPKSAASSSGTSRSTFTHECRDTTA